MELPEGYRLVEGPGRSGHAVLRADLPDTCLVDLWAAGTPLGQDVVGTGGGRGSVSALQVEGLELVARDLRRGGLLRHLLPEGFVDRLRTARELAALVQLESLGVACVEPIAALTERRRGLWVQRLCTRRFPGAVPLLDFLAAAPELRREAVQAAGRLVGAAFEVGLLHPDFHPENILVARRGARVEIRLCDLDRARIEGRPAREPQRIAMLTRMVRFVVKHRDRLPTRPARSELLRFLSSTTAARREALGELAVPDFAKADFRLVARELERQLRRRSYAD